ncbi:MAG: YggT family protein [Pseudomonadota bacterium]
MMTEISEFLLVALSHLILFVILLRLYLQLVRANFRNPLAQAIVQLTSPIVVPVRRIIPPIGQVDTATLIVAYAIQVLLIACLWLLYGIQPNASIFGIAVFELAAMSIKLFLWSIVIMVVLSWVAPGNYSPANALIDELTRPVLQPFRRWIKPVGGFDLSPLAAILALNVGLIIVNNLKRSFLS